MEAGVFEFVDTGYFDVNYEFPRNAYAIDSMFGHKCNISAIGFEPDGLL